MEGDPVITLNPAQIECIIVEQGLDVGLTELGLTPLVVARIHLTVLSR